MNNVELLQQELIKSYCDRSWLRLAGISREDIRKAGPVFYAAASGLLELADDKGRINAEDILAVWKKTAGQYFFDAEADEPAEGWLMNTYLYLRNKLFPHLETPYTDERITVRRISLLRFIRGAYEYERKNSPFDPRRDMLILSDSENKGDASFEYILDTYKSLNDTDEYKDEFNQLVRMMAKRSL